MKEQFASAILVVISAYFCLGTSCDDGWYSLQVERTLRFEPGQEEIQVRVDASGEAILLSTDQELAVDAPLETSQWQAGGAGGRPLNHDTCSRLFDGGPFESQLVPRKVHVCRKLESFDESIVFTLRRTSTLEAVDVEVRAAVYATGDCDGGPPRGYGVHLAEESVP